MKMKESACYVLVVMTLSSAQLLAARTHVLATEPDDSRPAMPY